MFCMLDNLWNEHFQIICLFCKFPAFICNSTCNSQDRSLFRLHYCFVGSFHAFLHSCCNGCRIQITDNGGGFSRSKMKQNTAEGHRSIGLQNIAGRIALSGGSFRIVSCPGLGTTARIILPMKGEEHIC